MRATTSGFLASRYGELDPTPEVVAGDLLDVVLVGLFWAARQGDHGVNDVIGKLRLAQLVEGHLRVLEDVMEEGGHLRPEAMHCQHHPHQMEDVWLCLP